MKKSCDENFECDLHLDFLTLKSLKRGFDLSCNIHRLRAILLKLYFWSCPILIRSDNEALEALRKVHVDNLAFLLDSYGTNLQHFMIAIFSLDIFSMTAAISPTIL